MAKYSLAQFYPLLKTQYAGHHPTYLTCIDIYAIRKKCPLTVTYVHPINSSHQFVQPNDHQKVEKADILGICYTVLEGIAKIADERPGKFVFRSIHIRSSKDPLQFTSRSAPVRDKI